MKETPDVLEGLEDEILTTGSPEQADNTANISPAEVSQPPKEKGRIESQVGYNTIQPETSPARQRERHEFLYDDPTSEDYVAPGDSKGMLRAITDSYFRQQPPEIIQIVKSRYERLLQRDPVLSTEEPRATVVIPIAIHNEKLSTLRDTLTEIAAQQV